MAARVQEMGIFRVIDSSRDITTSTIIKRIWANHESYMVSAVRPPAPASSSVPRESPPCQAESRRGLRIVTDRVGCCVQARNEKKQKSEAAYLASKSYVSES